jgi:hypothetical protein
MICTRKMVNSTFQDKHVSKDEKKRENGKKSCSRLVCLEIYQAMIQPKRMIFIMKIGHDVTFLLRYKRSYFVLAVQVKWTSDCRS